MDPIVEQYEKYPYPTHNTEQIERFKNGLNVALDSCPSRLGRAVWGGLRTNLEILSAGCGTSQAYCLAVKNPESRITGIDVSKSSLEMSRVLLESEKITNAILINSAILDHSDKYDVISCTGVLHHTANPIENLSHLASLLSDEGYISLSVYGPSVRQELRDFKKTIRELGLAQNPESVSHLKEIIDKLPEHHPAKNQIKLYGDFSTKEGFIDFFLNAREVDYSIDQLFEMVDQAGLSIYQFTYPTLYYPNFYLKGELLQRIKEFDLITQFSLTETLSYPRTMHSVILKKKGKDSLIFDTDALISRHKRVILARGLSVMRDEEKAVIEINVANEKTDKVLYRGFKSVDWDNMKQGCEIKEVPLFKKNPAVLSSLVKLGICELIS